MAKQSPRLRCAGHDQIVVAFADFLKNLVDYNPVPKADVGNSQTSSSIDLFILAKELPRASEHTTLTQS